MKIQLAFIFLVLTCQSFAIDSSHDFYTISKIKVIALNSDHFSYNEDKAAVSMGWGEIVRVGEQAWAIIKENKPILETQKKWGGALPQGATSWTQLQGWQAPLSYDYKVVAENPFGIKLVDITFKVIFTYGGSFQGKGKYLMNATILPANVNVFIGTKASVNVEIRDVFNMRSEEDPVAAMLLLVKTNIETPVQSSIATQSFSITGEGNLTEQ